MTSEYSQGYAAEQIRRSRNPFRRLIKSFYLENILKFVIGPSIDFACGAGQLLARLPHGSVGVEVNPFLINELAVKGLSAVLYEPDVDCFQLKDFPKNHYSTFIMVHVLEHFSDAAQIIKTLMRSCRRLGVKRIILVLPGLKGYLSDPTHKTFIDNHYLLTEGVFCEGYMLRKQAYFPVNKESFGKYFIFNEYIVVLDRKD